MVHQVRQRLSLDGHPQARQVREVRRAQPTRLVLLREEYFLSRAVPGTPLPDPPFQGPTRPLPPSARVLLFQPPQQRLGLQPGFALQPFFQPWPHLGERVDPRAPRVRCAFQGRAVAIFACRLGIHARLHRCVLQRCPFVQMVSQFLDLCRTDSASCCHGKLLLLKVLPV
jgi:hypothetical protein